MIGLPLVFAGIVALITWSLRWQQFIPYPPIVLVGMVFGAVFLHLAITNLAPFEMMTFRSHAGVPVFDIFKEEKQAAEFEDFVSAVIDVIRTSKVNEPTSQP